MEQHLEVFEHHDGPELVIVTRVAASPPERRNLGPIEDAEPLVPALLQGEYLALIESESVREVQKLAYILRLSALW